MTTPAAHRVLRVFYRDYDNAVGIASSQPESLMVSRIAPLAERLLVKADNFLLPLREPLKNITREKLLQERLERAIGVIYRPETELQSHYFYASLPHQFDEYIWFDETRAVEALTRETTKDMPDTFPFGL